MVDEKKSFRLANEAVRQRAIEAVSSAPDGFIVKITPPKRDRSAAQHRLYFLWNGVISAYTGETKEEVHWRNKETHLMPIYVRDSQSFAEMVSAINEVKRQGLEGQYRSLWSKIVEMTSTTDASVKQFAEYLNDIERECISMGVALPHPEDIWHEAMGRW